MTIAEFLLARIAEDDAVARDAQTADIHTVDHEHMVRQQPARVLAECEAKRRIVEMYANRIGRDGGHPALAGQCEGLGLAVTALASVYADHPDFHVEWRM